MYFQLSEEHPMIQETIRKFLDMELVPIVEEIHEKEKLPLHLYNKLGEMDFIGLHFPEEYGGGRRLYGEVHCGHKNGEDLCLSLGLDGGK